jgi:CMP-2-keto-3-deoxyoctulosonic acid synthetase
LPLLATPRTPLSSQEDLEQLTWMERGARIGVVCLTKPHPPGVDTLGDLTRVRQLYKAQHSSES